MKKGTIDQDLDCWADLWRRIKIFFPLAQPELKEKKMLKENGRFRFMLALVLGVSLLCSGAFAKGEGNRGEHRGNNGRGDSQSMHREKDRRDYSRDDQGSHRGHRYHYRAGRWYTRGWFGWEFAVSALAIGALVESLPPRHTMVVVENVTYYHDDVVYYKPLPDGAYVVVPAPRNR